MRLEVPIEHNRLGYVHEGKALNIIRCGRSQKVVAKLLVEAINQQAANMNTRSYFWSPARDACYALYYSDGWRYDIITPQHDVTVLLHNHTDYRSAVEATRMAAERHLSNPTKGTTEECQRK
jgi:hypothetical protein